MYDLLLKANLFLRRKWKEMPTMMRVSQPGGTEVFWNEWQEDIKRNAAMSLDLKLDLKYNHSLISQNAKPQCSVNRRLISPLPQFVQASEGSFWNSWVGFNLENNNIKNLGHLLYSVRMPFSVSPLLMPEGTLNAILSPWLTNSIIYVEPSQSSIFNVHRLDRKMLWKHCL